MGPVWGDSGDGDEQLARGAPEQVPGRHEDDVQVAAVPTGKIGRKIRPEIRQNPIFDVFSSFWPVFGVLEARDPFKKLPGVDTLRFHRIRARGEPPVYKMFYFSCFSTTISSDRLFNSNAFC